MKNDIEKNADIRLLVDAFYEKIKADDIIGYIFSDTSKIDWNKQLPMMYQFWENSLFFTGVYQGNPMKFLIHINQLVPLSALHFSQWIKIFNSTVDELFVGKVASLAKQRAASIAMFMQSKIIVA